MNKKVLVFFPFVLEKVHFRKDVVILPTLFSQRGDSVTFIGKNGDQNIDINQSKDIEFQLSKSPIFNFIQSVIKRRYNIICFFHFSPLTLFLVLITKILSPNSKIYVKGDFNIDDIWLYGKIGSKLVIPLIRVIALLSDYISVETKHTHKKISDFIGEKCLYFPNGVFDNELDFPTKKENIAITVGRLGTYQKNTKLFLKIAGELLENNIVDTVYAIGPIDPDFQYYLDNFFLENPQFDGKIVFLGKIVNPNEVNEWYMRANYFILSSEHESFGLVLLESASKGCTIISTDVGGASDITDNWEYGFRIPFEPIQTIENINMEKYRTHLKDFIWDHNFEILYLKV